MKKSKRKNNTAASRALDAEWEALKNKYAKLPSFSGTTTGRVKSDYVPVYHEFPRGNTPKDGVTVRSLPDTPGGIASTAPTHQYTGTKMLGVATLHKSNAVPVFQVEDAQDIAKMRR